MEVPSGVEVKVDGSKIVAKANGKAAEYKFNSKLLNVKVEGNNLIVATNMKGKRKLNAVVLAVEAHVRSLFKGVTAGFEKKLQVVFAHFPVSVEVKGKEVVIKNFLGEKMPRVADIVGSTQVKVAGQEITVSGSEADAVGQTAANIVQATKIVGKDLRVFQDGIYLVK